MSRLSGAELAEYARAMLAASFPSVPLAVRELPDDDAVAVCTRVRGGGTLIVGADRSTLFVGSARSMDDAIADFRRGARSDPGGER